VTVIAWDGKTMAADKRMGFGAEHATVTKITKIRGCLVGFAGGSALGRAMLNWFEKGCIPEDYPVSQRNDDKCGSLLVIHPDGKIVHFSQEPFGIPVEEKFYAVGSGSPFASAAMYLGYDARRAVEVASALDMNCGNGIDMLELHVDFEPALRIGVAYGSFAPDGTWISNTAIAMSKDDQYRHNVKHGFIKKVEK